MSASLFSFDHVTYFWRIDYSPPPFNAFCVGSFQQPFIGN
nr:6205_t:CDS:2 [Entrophospora candida]